MIFIIIFIIIVIIINNLRPLLLVAPVYSVETDNNLLLKVSERLAQWYLQLCFFLASKYQSQNPWCPQ